MYYENLGSGPHLFGLGPLNPIGVDLPKINAEIKTTRSRNGVTIRTKDYNAKILLLDFYHKKFFRVYSAELAAIRGSYSDCKIPYSFCKLLPPIFKEISKAEFMALINKYSPLPPMGVPPSLP